MFVCDKCGICCRSISGILSLQEYDRGDGVCVHLNDDTNLCMIYDARPMICQVDECYDHFFSHISRDDFDDWNTQACLELKLRYGADSIQTRSEYKEKGCIL